MLGVALGSGVLRALAALKIGLLAFLALWGFGLGPRRLVEPRRRSGRSGRAREPLAGGPGRRLDRGLHLARGLVGRQQDRRRGPRPRAHAPAGPVAGRVDRHGRCTSPSAWCSSTWSRRARSTSDQGDEAFAALAGEALFGRAGEVVFAPIVVVSVVGSLAAVLMAFPRVYYAMARDGLFFPSFAARRPAPGHPRAGDRHPGGARHRAGADPARSTRSSPTSWSPPWSSWRWPSPPSSSCAAGRRPRPEPSSSSRATRSRRCSSWSRSLIVIVLRPLRDPTQAAIGLGVVALGPARLACWIVHGDAPPASVSAGHRDDVDPSLDDPITNP